MVKNQMYGNCINKLLTSRQSVEVMNSNFSFRSYSWHFWVYEKQETVRSCILLVLAVRIMHCLILRK